MDSIEMPVTSDFENSNTCWINTLALIFVVLLLLVEPFGRDLIETMAMKKPVVAIRTGVEVEV